MPQVDILKAGVDLFLTHGGQNSFMESLSVGSPVVVCPGFGDQPVNAQKAVDLGVGLQVKRPMCQLEDVEEELLKYQAQVKVAVTEVFQNESYRSRAQKYSQELQDAGGVHRAVDLLLGIDQPQKLGGAWCSSWPHFLHGLCFDVWASGWFCAKIIAILDILGQLTWLYISGCFDECIVLGTASKNAERIQQDV